MKNIFNKALLFIVLISAIGFTSCEDSNETFAAEVTIQNKITLLESSEWLLKGFEDRVMHTFVNGERFTYYGSDNVFADEAIPGTQQYTITGEFLTLDLNFGNIKTYEVKFSCDNNIVEFYENGELNSTMYKRGSSYEVCL